MMHLCERDLYQFRRAAVTKVLLACSQSKMIGSADIFLQGWTLLLDTSTLSANLHLKVSDFSSIKLGFMISITLACEK